MKLVYDALRMRRPCRRALRHPRRGVLHLLLRMTVRLSILPTHSTHTFLSCDVSSVFRQLARFSVLSKRFPSLACCAESQTKTPYRSSSASRLMKAPAKHSHLSGQPPRHLPGRHLAVSSRPHASRERRLCSLPPAGARRRRRWRTRPIATALRRARVLPRHCP